MSAYRDRRVSNGIAGATVVKELNSSGHLLDVAMKLGNRAPYNVAKMVRRPSVARGRDPRLAVGEESPLLDACAKSRARMLAPAVRFALATAMRVGEILSLHGVTSISTPHRYPSRTQRRVTHRGRAAMLHACD